MQFTNLADFITMNGHGFYVWLSYGAAAILFFFLIYISRSEDLQVRKKIIQREQRNKKLKAAAKHKQNRD